MSIYTKTGDNGETSLADCRRVSKADPRLETYGTADELNAWVGMLRAALQQVSACRDSDAQLLWIQNKLFNLGASLSAAPGEWLTADDTAQIEHWIDDMQASLPPLRAFILPAGSELVARCHICRTVTRRLERLMVAVGHLHPEERRFVNRVSDYFFVLSRSMGEKEHITMAIWHK